MSERKFTYEQAVTELDDMKNSNVPWTFPEAWESVKDRLAALEAENAELREKVERLLCKINKVTAPHRHGNKIRKVDLDNLSNCQIEVEQALKEGSDGII